MLTWLCPIQNLQQPFYLKKKACTIVEDFMFRLTGEEFTDLKSQIVIPRWGRRRTLPNAFTEHGVLMLSSILNSERAILVNIQIMRIYTRIREMLLLHKDVLLLVEQVEKKLIKQDQKIELLFSYLSRFIEKEEQPRTAIGFRTKKDRK